MVFLSCLAFEGMLCSRHKVVLDSVDKKLQKGRIAQENRDRLLTSFRNEANDLTASKGASSIIASLSTKGRSHCWHRCVLNIGLG